MDLCRKWQDAQLPRPIPTKRAGHPNCSANLEAPAKCPKCPLEGSPSPTESQAPAPDPVGALCRNRTLTPAQTRAPQPVKVQTAGKMDAPCAQLSCPSRISSDLRGPFVGRESNKLEAYGGGQRKVISIREGSPRSQANTDKFCNTSSSAT